MFLEKILKLKREEVLNEQKKIPLDLIKKEITRKNSTISLFENLKSDEISIIAELKKASPSLGIIRSNYVPEKIAKIYEENGASAISVLTEKKIFLGSNLHLESVKKMVNIPVLRKDFIISEYQIYQSKRIGADAILLIAACLEKHEIETFLKISDSINIECIVEVHNEEDVEKIRNLKIDIIGINNRNLKTFEVNLETSFRLKKLLPPGILTVSESGISSIEDIRSLKNNGFNGVLIGEVFMKSNSPGAKLKEFLEGIS